MGASRSDSEVKHCCKESISLSSMCKLTTPGACNHVCVLEEHHSDCLCTGVPRAAEGGCDVNRSQYSTVKY